ncbi:hypothetical protein [Vibrio taketomensis]|uniref:hypothetical protein n=1 Tax=Vibrio taketomensis TaxID=2572923 RepID=UPI0015823471|nr:hypothetical protein [Vibrio taketomensis]
MQRRFSTFLTLTFTRKQRLGLFGGMDETEDGLIYTPIKFIRDKGELVYGKDGVYTLLPQNRFALLRQPKPLSVKKSVAFSMPSKNVSTGLGDLDR